MIQYTQLKRGWLHGLLTPDRFALDAPLRTPTGIVGYFAQTDDGLVTLDPGGILRISPTWQWDGASGPTWDTKRTMRASAVHDAGYALMRAELIPAHTKPAWDSLLWRILREDGCSSFRAVYWLAAVDLFGGNHI